MTQPRFGNGTGPGRRLKIEPETADKFVSKRQEPVAKARPRDYNSEDRRQRRLGMAQAATGGAGIAGLALGGRGLIKTTRAARKIAGLNGKDAAALERVRSVHRSGVLASRKDLAALGIGSAGLAGAGAVRQHAEDPRNRRYL